MEKTARRQILNCLTNAFHQFQNEKKTGKAYLAYKTAETIYDMHSKFCKLEKFEELFKEAVLQCKAKCPSAYDDFNGTYFTLVMMEMEEEIKNINRE